MSFGSLLNALVATLLIVLIGTLVYDFYGQLIGGGWRFFILLAAASVLWTGLETIVQRIPRVGEYLSALDFLFTLIILFLIYAFAVEPAVKGVDTRVAVRRIADRPPVLLLLTTFPTLMMIMALALGRVPSRSGWVTMQASPLAFWLRVAFYGLVACGGVLGLLRLFLVGA